jgi:hypothetical protein
MGALRAREASRCTRAARAARAIAADALVRTRSFSTQADGSAMRSALGTCVSRLTTASAPVERAAQRRLVEDVGLDGARSEGREPLAPARGARHAPDAVAGGEHLADGAPPDDACGPGYHDLVHADPTRYPARS